jgi:hypothetical protein
MQQLMRPYTRPFCLSLMALLLCSCARVNDTGLRLVSTKRDAYLIVNGQLLTGNVLLVPDRTGRVSFFAEKGVITACSGSLRYTATHSGEVDLHCSDGTQVTLLTTLIGETRGYGYGSTAQGPSSLVFGMPDQDASALLTAPPGKSLVIGSATGALELQ